MKNTNRGTTILQPAPASLSREWLNCPTENGKRRSLADCDYALGPNLVEGSFEVPSTSLDGICRHVA